jgi:hypothetical protein
MQDYEIQSSRDFEVQIKDERRAIAEKVNNVKNLLPT